MPLYTRSQIAKMCGKARSQVTMAVSSGKFVMSGDYIDDTIDRNKSQIELWVSKMKAKIPKDVYKPKPKKKKKKAELKIKTPNVQAPNLMQSRPAPNVQEPDIEDIEDEENDSLATLKIKAEIRWKHESRRKLEIENAKRRGESIPIRMVMSVISSLGSSFQTSYKTGADSLLMQFNHKHKIPHEDVAKLGGTLDDLINSSHRKAISLCKKELKNVISQLTIAIDDINDQDSEE